MAASTHKVEIGRIKIEPHPNADKLDVGTFQGYTCCVEKGRWKDGDLVAFVPPDSVVSTSKPEFAFLGTKERYRIKAKKLRGVLSFGLVIAAPPGMSEGDDAAEFYGVTHYEPELHQKVTAGGVIIGGEAIAGPKLYCPKYDLEAGRRYAQDVFIPGETVIVTEKIHGANARYVFWDGQLYCGSRAEWKAEYPSYDHVTMDYLLAQGLTEGRAASVLDTVKNKKPQKNIWWQAKDKHPEIEDFCRQHPNVILFGEVYGAVQDLNYGHDKGDVSFIAFDALNLGKWYDPARVGYDGRCVPEVYTGPYDFDTICGLAEGPSLLYPSHVREGVVVKPVVEREHRSVGRVALKWVGAGYLERS